MRLLSRNGRFEDFGVKSGSIPFQRLLRPGSAATLRGILLYRHANAKKRCSSSKPEREAINYWTPLVAALTPTAYGCKNIGELNDAESVFNHPNQAGAGQQRLRTTQPRGLSVHRQFSQPEPRERLLVRGRTPTRKTICYCVGDNRQVTSPTITFPRIAINHNRLLRGGPSLVAVTSGEGQFHRVILGRHRTGRTPGCPDRHLLMPEFSAWIGTYLRWNNPTLVSTPKPPRRSVRKQGCLPVKAEV